MTEPQTVTSEVEVAVDPATAFVAFTEEMDLWWMRGPINFCSDGGRVVEVRCERESALGGRARWTTSTPKFASIPLTVVLG